MEWTGRDGIGGGGRQGGRTEGRWGWGSENRCIRSPGIGTSWSGACELLYLFCCHGWTLPVPGPPSVTITNVDGETYIQSGMLEIKTKTYSRSALRQQRGHWLVFGRVREFLFKATGSTKYRRDLFRDVLRARNVRTHPRKIPCASFRPERTPQASNAQHHDDNNLGRAGLLAAQENITCLITQKSYSNCGGSPCRLVYDV